MNHFTHARSAHFSRPGLAEAIAEVSLTAAAAAFTAAIWLSVGAWAIEPVRPVDTAVAGAPAARHVTLPTVVIVGRRDFLEATPVTTTAQNTAANPITLRQ
ncbi:MAG: hypothetical protein Q8R01_08025 [Ramlibacter sp.]|nr:hypothetical protein [Ramlibacter sp.]